MATVRRPGAYHCGIDAAMDVIGGKWKVLILWALDERACRFGELRRQVSGVTEKVLASHLRELEEDGIVHREVYDEVPPRVEYSLTPLGVLLNEALAPLGAWGREHVIGGMEDARHVRRQGFSPASPDGVAENRGEHAEGAAYPLVLQGGRPDSR
ncbi:winged helix-turn-helix transcriptional regulator [Streptosporangium roseum]|uniref:winged helix-turn-helix transcriptional regulator n=1 Tax=Streptosporangium roseum TaxID=2001 RepID=UPI0004CDD4FA|nr:helix-turn-helix domain-containing protein [Streptosporangium roseum]